MTPESARPPPGRGQASEIQLVERASGNPFPSAPSGSVLASSVPLGWRGIMVEWQRLRRRSGGQIDSAVARALAPGPVDVVFNNAGYGLAGPLEGLSEEQIRRMVDTNLLGAIRTTKAFVPHFRERGSGLFINTTSIGGLITVPFNSLYHATKWALEGWSESMAFELQQVGIGMKIIEPGGMKTDFFTRSFDVGRHPAYDPLVDKVMRAITDPRQMATYSTPEQIAEVVYTAATDGKDQLRYVAGADARATYDARLQLGEAAFRRGIRQQFFGS